ncbi:Legume lectin domain-containing protein [Fontibacillus panacisegetis]|uniref:Legume lectin domain-containing protein n=1 Tax=Fontibacillus panacisegetis TaxID=670482 RepID=A0A1G7L5A7_9BACL|nr:S-layer homology domain-containing protein [Fontibacillus panacisegetis]SDF44722.1 Legume lectin domain-containing protein [Fontibacillus panacisegetis]
MDKHVIRKQRKWRRWLHAALAFVIVCSGLSLYPTSRADAGNAPVGVDLNKSYISLKNAGFGTSNPLVGSATITATDSSTVPSGLIQLGNASSSALQYNYGVKSGGTKYSAAELTMGNDTTANRVGFQNDGSRDIIRLATTKGNAFGSLFNKERVALSDNRSFSTYFSFKMESGSQADGIVFAVQTVSNEAGASGGGLGYSGVTKSFGVEYDTYYNYPKDGTEDRSDPAPVEGVTSTRTSHVALVRDGDVHHASAKNGGIREGKNIATLDLGKMSLAQTNSEATSDPYTSFHTWIDYDGVTQKFQVYLIRENDDKTYWAPVVSEDGKLVKEGSPNKIQSVKLSSFPVLRGTDLVADRADAEGSFTIKPIISDTTDLSSLLLQDDAFIGFTAATGGSTQNHDIYSWYFNNYSGLIVPETATPQEVEQAPTQINILHQTPLVKDGAAVDFKKYGGNQDMPYGTEVVPVNEGETSNAQGIIAAGSQANVEAEVRTIDGQLIAGYPVTFSLYYISEYTSQNIGSGRTAWAATQKDDEKLYLTADGYTVTTRHYTRNGQDVTVREITVPTDENGVAKVNVWNLGNYPHLTNVKARIGGEIQGKVYGGGNFDSAPVLFAEGVAPHVVKAEVGPDRRTVIVDLDVPVDFDSTETGGFSINIGTANDPILVPLKIVDFVKDKYGENDPFRLKLEIDSNSPDFPTNLPNNYVIPAGSKPPLWYNQNSGSVQGSGTGGLPLESFPTAGGGDIPVINRFEPESMSVKNDQSRNAIEITFPDSVNVPSEALQAFEVTINDGINPAFSLLLNSSNASMVYDPASPNKLSLSIADGLPAAWGGQIPLNAEVSLTYNPENLNAADRITDASSSELDTLINDPVHNQMRPVQATVINDETRDKVRVVFGQALEPISVVNSVYSFSFNIDGIPDPVLVDSVVFDSGDASGKTLIFTLGDGIPSGGIPVLLDELNGTNITLNYSTNQLNPIDGGLIDIRESGPNARSLGWLSSFPVDNQLMFEPIAAAVGNDRNTIKVKFPSVVEQTGSPEIWVTIDNGDGNPVRIAGVVTDGNGTDTLTLQLENDTEVPPSAKVQLGYVSNGGSIVDAGDPQRALRPLGPQTGNPQDFPVNNVYVTIDEPLDGWRGSKPVTQITGTSEPGSVVSLVVKDNNQETIEGSLSTNPDGSWSWIPLTPISVDGTYQVTATAAGTLSTTAVSAIEFTMDSTVPLGGGVELTATPVRNVGDGESTTKLIASVTDSNSNPVAGAKVVFDVPAAGGIFVDINGQPLAAPEAVTGPDGKAVVYYQSPDLTGMTGAQEIGIKASVFDLVHEVSGEASFTIFFDPPKLKGKITETVDSAGVQPVAGKVITIKGEDGTVVGTVTTDKNGEYEFLIPSKQQYTIEYSKEISDGKSITYKQKASIDRPIKGDGTDEFTANKAVAGVIGSKDSNGLLHLIDFSAIQNTPANPNFVVFLKKGEQYVNSTNPSGALLNTAAETNGFEVDQNGLFIADGLPQGNASDNSYKLEIRYYYNVLDSNGQVVDRRYIVINVKRNGDLPSVTVQAAGELNINEELIDPYGDIRNSVTGQLINDRNVTVKLWYADTARNRNNGITPGPVTLPKLPGFPPANNDSPTQIVSGGAYAWMVYADSDYYITAEAAGYQTYDSRNDKSAHPESSVYTENGLTAIKVEYSIVRFDIFMAPVSSSSGDSSSGSGGSSSSGSATPPAKQPDKATPEPQPDKAPEIAVNLQSDRTIHPESGKGTVDVLYKNISDVELKQGQIRVTLPDGVKVLDAAGGEILAGVIVWNIKDLKANTSGSFKIVLQWPLLADGQQELNVTLKGEFADKQGIVSNAQGSASSIKLLVYSDRAGNLKHQRYILGYPDGTFKSERYLNRAELAAIIARLIGEYGVESKSYSDVSTSSWAYDYINTVTKHDIFEGGTDGKFRPNDPVSRGELAAVMARYLKLETGKPLELHYTDVTSDYWATSAIESLYRNGMIAGYPDGSFKPSNSIIRSEAVTLINRMLYRGPLTEVEQTWPDIAPSFWAFQQIEEASVSHESRRAEINGKTVEIFVQRIEDEVK